MTFSRIIPGWATLRAWSASRVLQTSLYWLAIVPIAVSVLQNAPGEIAVPLRDTSIRISLKLPFAWSALWGAGIAGFAAQAILHIACPKPIRDFRGYSEFRDAGLNREYLIDQLLRCCSLESKVPNTLRSTHPSEILYRVLMTCSNYMNIHKRDEQKAALMVEDTISFDDYRNRVIPETIYQTLTVAAVRKELHRGLNYRSFKSLDGTESNLRSLFGSFRSHVSVSLLPVRTTCSLLLLTASVLYAIVFIQGAYSVLCYLLQQ